MKNHLDVVNETIDEQIAELKVWKKKLNESINEVIDLILACEGRVIVSGVGKSGLIARKMVATFASTGTPSFFVHPTEAFHGDLGKIKPIDVVLLISYSGETDEVIKLIPSIRGFGNKIVAMTGNANSTLAKNSDYLLSIEIEKEVCPNNLAPTTSTLVNLALGDALAVALMKARKFRPEDFARYHPGGSLGRKLLNRVTDEMRKKRLPFVEADSSLAECLLRMTTSKMGVALVGSASQLEGIITDGDIRRSLLDSKMDIGLKASEIMTKDPYCIPHDMFVCDAEKMLLEKKVKSLVVKNNDDEVIGIFELTQ